MSNVSSWNVSAALNNQTPPDGAPEGQAPSTVNDVIRENMAAPARWYQDTNGTLITGGTGNAYTLTTNSGYAALTEVPILAFRPHVTNTAGGTTLDVDGLGPKSVLIPGFATLPAGALRTTATVTVAYNSGDDAFRMVGGTGIDAFAAFPSGTRMLFQQTAAPTGWTKETDPSFNDRALRLVTGSAASGGATVFTTVFGSGKTTAGHVLTSAQMPSHTHTYFNGSLIQRIDPGQPTSPLGRTGNDVSTGSTGNDQAHSHGLSLNLAFRDVIVAQKD